MSLEDESARLRAAMAQDCIRGLYGMVDLPARGDDLPARAEALALALLDGGARVLQLRMKGAEGRAMLEVADLLCELCHERGALFVVNDRLDVAIATGAGGVHLGQDDLPLEAARAVSPPGLLIGVSTHDEEQAALAIEGGADYLGFGPVFATRTKENPDAIVGVERLAALCARSSIPVVAIGGIDLASLSAVVAAGAAAAALIAAVNLATDVTSAAAAATAAFPRR